MVIGIIDDDEYEIDSIQRTIITIIKRNNWTVDNINFKIYDLNSKTGKLTESLITQVIEDISEYKISLLITPI